MKKLSLFTLLCMITALVSAQVSVVSSTFNTFNVSANSILQVGLMNTQTNDVEVRIEAVVYNSDNEEIIRSVSLPVWLKPGFNSTAQLPLKIASTSYGASSYGDLLKRSSILPSGVYRYCAYVIGTRATEARDSYCDEVQSDFSSFLTLVAPADKETINTKTPVLSWTHSEPFDVKSSGNYYRMVVVEMEKGQKAESAIKKNQPVLQEDFLGTHQVNYPFDAPELTAGKRYAWQVQQVSNQRIINKTEAWEFTLDRSSTTNYKYAKMKKSLDGGFHRISTNLLYVAFDEDYFSEGNFNCVIMDHSEILKPDVKTDNDAGIDVKKNGVNQYELDLNGLNLSNGYYTLKAWNEKNEAYYLKFYLGN